LWVNLIQFGQERTVLDGRVRAFGYEIHRCDQLTALVLGKVCEHRLSEGSAVCRYGCTHTQFKVDLVLAPAVTKEAMNVEDTRTIEHAHADCVTCLGAQISEWLVRPYRIAKLSDYPGARVGCAGGETILACVALLQVAELNEGGGVAVGCGAAEAGQVGEFRYAQQLITLGEHQKQLHAA
jgi:hypothetical protein